MIIKKASIPALLCLLGFAGLLVWAAEPDSPVAEIETQSVEQDTDKQPAETESAKPQAVDVTEKMREFNSDKFAGPPTEFREGHVKARKLDPKAIVKTEAGFVVKLPSGAPIPTPTVDDGKVYVSGGFHSKEFYCFDAATGEVVWAIDLDDDGPSSAVVQDGICVFNTESCTIFAVNSQTGSHLWSHWLGDPLTSTPAIAGGKVFTSYPAAGGGGGLGQQGFGGQIDNAEINDADNNDAENNDAEIPDSDNTNNENNPAESTEVEQQLQQLQNFAPQSVDNNEAEVEEDPDGKKRPPLTHVLACLDLKTGKFLWQKWIDSDVMTSPVCVDDEVFITTFAGTVMKFDQATGKIISAKRERATCAPVVVGKDVLYTQRADNGEDEAPVEEALAINNRADGQVRLNVNRKVAKHIDNKVQAKADLQGKAEQLDAANGFAGPAPQAANPDAAWDNIGYGRVSSMQAFQGSRGCVMGRLAMNCPGDEIICNDVTTGQVKWKIKLEGDLEKVGGFLAAPPAAAGKHLFVSTLDGHVLQMDPGEGKVVKKHKVGGPVRFQPAIMDGRIYVGTQDGQLVAIDTKDRTLTGWSGWGGDAAHTGVQQKR